ncbi:MAG: protein translocase subunit SecD [Clostridia bacterium]|nr:protein translocase subunit SecD [Clostridia bacterium]
MKRKGKWVLFVTALLILAFSLTAFFGIYTEVGDLDLPVIKGANDIRWGIDIRGGVEVTFNPVDEDGKIMEATEAQLNAAQEIIGTRLTDNHITDYELYVDYENSRLIVRFPWKEGESNFDPQKAIEEISVTAMLTFREGNNTVEKKDEEGNVIGYEPDGVTKENIILNGNNVKEATAYYSSSDGTYGVNLKLDEYGTKQFAEYTKKLATTKGTISIWLDDEMISYPTVNEEIATGEASITGSFTAEQATKLANQINAGALPFQLTVSSYNSINPTLGTSALNAMLLAGVIALVLICIFMIVVYRLPGVVACLTLLGQVAIIIACTSGYFPDSNSFTLTLPGIAGIILSIGMGVDANIITDERIREELRKGKSLDSAIAAGSKESASAIIDGNVTNVIVAVILMGVFGSPNGLCYKLLSPFLFMFGTSVTGSIYSFGYTLLIGVIANFVMGVGATRLLMYALTKFNVFRKKWLFGGARDAE